MGASPSAVSKKSGRLIHPRRLQPSEALQKFYPDELTKAHVEISSQPIEKRNALARTAYEHLTPSFKAKIHAKSEEHFQVRHSEFQRVHGLAGTVTQACVLRSIYRRAYSLPLTIAA